MALRSSAKTSEQLAKDNTKCVCVRPKGWVQSASPRVSFEETIPLGLDYYFMFPLYFPLGFFADTTRSVLAVVKRMYYVHACM